MITEQHHLKAVRGATLLSTDTDAAFKETLEPLIEGLLSRNNIDLTQVVNVFFTQTVDLQSDNPARVCRKLFGWANIPMFCSQEPKVLGMPERCIRVLIQFYGDHKEPCQPVYFNGAEALRPDLPSSGLS